MARILVDYGAAIDATNASGMTALHISAAEGDEPLVKYFYGVRANAAIADNEGKAIHNKHAMKDVGVPNIYLHKEITSIEVTIFAHNSVFVFYYRPCFDLIDKPLTP